MEIINKIDELDSLLFTMLYISGHWIGYCDLIMLIWQWLENSGLDSTMKIERFHISSDLLCLHNILQTHCKRTHIATVEQWSRPQVAGSTQAVGAGCLNPQIWWNYFLMIWSSFHVDGCFYKHWLDYTANTCRRNESLSILAIKNHRLLHNSMRFHIHFLANILYHKRSCDHWQLVNILAK